MPKPDKLDTALVLGYGDSTKIMSEKAPIYIFHMNRTEGKPVFYHPFTESVDFIAKIHDSEVLGKYGDEPRVESITLLRNELYRYSEAAIKGWMSDLRFVPRFILSAAVFLVVYFFMSYVIRDPIPLIDELVSAFAGGILAYYLLGKRYLNSNIAVNKRIEIRSKIDGISFSESEFLKRVETAVHELDLLQPKVLAEVARSKAGFPLEQEMKEEAKSWKTYVETRFSAKSALKFRKRMTKLTESRKRNNDEALEKFLSETKADASLFIVFEQIKKSL